CIDEVLRVLRPGGILFLSTTNVLCPIQAEFNLPLYSWYPAAVKRRYERLAATTRPELANYARYPAVNWFSYYGLRRLLGTRGLICCDRFDLMESARRSFLQRAALRTIRSSRVVRFIAQVCSPGTIVFAVRAR
ncbi:MAG: hypothetical protein ACREFQ_19470, partial [Stellaceae bacterium]